MNDLDYARAEQALDYPMLDSWKFFAWVWNGVKWPDGRRYVVYLSDTRTPAGYRMFTGSWQGAVLFDTADAAREAVAELPNSNNVIVSDVWYLRQIVGYDAPETPELLRTATGRGFSVAYFVDRSDVKCSVQKSSLATEDAIWFGPEEADPKVLVPGQGWQKVPLPAGCVANTRMHLTREHVIALLPFLQRFAETGELE